MMQKAGFNGHGCCRRRLTNWDCFGSEIQSVWAAGCPAPEFRRSFGHYLTGAGEGDGDDTMTEDVEQHLPKDDGGVEGAGVIIPRTWGRAMESLS